MRVGVDYPRGETLISCGSNATERSVATGRIDPTRVLESLQVPWRPQLASCGSFPANAPSSAQNQCVGIVDPLVGIDGERSEYQRPLPRSPTVRWSPADALRCEGLGASHRRYEGNCVAFALDRRIPSREQFPRLAADLARA